ncbi:MAG: hypothetical protein JNK55_23495 [Rubrivivax sp.]|nr:hypothetical protein [Rubrivivax sp.]
MNARRTLLAAALGVCAAAASAVPAAAAPEATLQFDGALRAEALAVAAAPIGPLAQAVAVQPGHVDLPRSSQAATAEWHAAWQGLAARGELRQRRVQGQATRSESRLNELQVSGGMGGWQFSAGQKIVGWDVGFAWRPNDVVQQEARRSLLSTVPEGRRLLMAEYFSADTAWSLVWVNPGVSAQRRGAEEPALALRTYRQAGAVDWHGFARWGRRTRGSVGGAVSWVAGEALELHTSLRWQVRTDALAFEAAQDPGGAVLLSRSPWQPLSQRAVRQALIGGTWTHASNQSLLVEAWWDGAALSAAQWDQWRRRNGGLREWAATPAPAEAVAGNLAWQGQAFTARPNLQRRNLYLRWSATHEAWQPALDVLWHPADGGQLWTATLGWQGDRWRVEAGWRQTAGPAEAVLMQVPTRRTAYASASWAF